jgi:hypothetical protein
MSHDELRFLLPSVSPLKRLFENQATATNSSLLYRESLITTAPRPLFTGNAVLRTRKGVDMDPIVKKEVLVRNNKDDKGIHVNRFIPSDLVIDDNDDDVSNTKTLDPFTFIGVELLHLLRFICVNAMVSCVARMIYSIYFCQKHTHDPTL